MRTSFRRSAVALALALAAAATFGLASVGTAAPGAAPAGALALSTPTPQPDYSKTTCAVTTSTTVQPGAFLLGESMAVTRTVRGACAGMTFPLHIVLVLDGTASMAGSPAAELKRAMREFVDAPEHKFGSVWQIGVVTFDVRGREVCALTHRVDHIQRCIERIGAVGDSTIGDGLEAGMRTLFAGRDRWPGLPADEIREVIVLVSGGAAAVRCADAQRQAGQAAERGMLVISVCVGRECDVACMTGLASSWRYYFDGRSVERLIGAFRPFRNADVNIILKQLTVTETLPAEVSLVAGSPNPPATTVLEHPTRLVWRVSDALHEGFTVTYRVHPRAPGYRALSDGMRGIFQDNRNLYGAFTFAQPWTRVLAPPEPAVP